MPWPLKLITWEEWEQRESFGQLEVGHCCYSHKLDHWMDQPDEILAQRFGSQYMALPKPRRLPIVIELPGRCPWFIDMRATNDSGRHGAGWQVSGELPNLTITPSINFVGTYHGYVTGGMVTDDCEGRTFAPPLPQPQPPESPMNDLAPTTTDAAPAAAPADAAPHDAAPETAAIEPIAPFAWSGQAPTPQRFVLYVLKPGVIRPAIVVAVGDQDVELAVLLTHQDHASCAAIIGASKVRQDQDGKGVGTWHWSTFQTSSVVANVSDVQHRLDEALAALTVQAAQIAALGAQVATLAARPAAVVPEAPSIAPGGTFEQCITPAAPVADAPAAAPSAPPG